MSSFKEKLNYVNKIFIYFQLFTSQFGQKSNNLNNYYINTTPSKTNLSSSRNNSFYSNRLSNQKDLNNRTNSFSIRKYSENVFNRNNSYYSPNNSDRRSFNNFIGTEINDNLLRYRENSGKKFKTRIKKEIDFLSNSFKSPRNYNNKLPIKKKSNFDNFPLTYTTTVSSLKNYNRSKKNDLRHYILPKNENDDEITLLYRQIKEKRNNRISNF